MRFFVIDTETGGLDPEKHALLSIGGVVVDRMGAPLGMLELLVNDAGELCEDALRHNKVDPELARSAGLQPADAVRALHAFLRAYFPGAFSEHPRPEDRVVLAGHNVAFDAAFLRRLYRLAGQDFEQVYSHRMLDTGSIRRFLALAGILPDIEPSLGRIAEELGIETVGLERHTALGDALLTARVLRRMIEIAQAMRAEIRESAGV
jgi:DNA polymerase III epsilon subunit-like protein